MNSVYNVLIVGIGGQGVILASNVLGEACIVEGRSVRCSETHGMAQRGGSVESHVRINELYSPLIPPGQADLILSFELLEAVRYRHYLKEDGTMLLNDLLIIPTSVFLQKVPRPTKEDIITRLRGGRYHLISASSLASEAGSPLTQNIVMVGAASQYIPLSHDSVIEGMQRWIPRKTIETNLKAFELGKDAVKSDASS